MYNRDRFLETFRPIAPLTDDDWDLAARHVRFRGYMEGETIFTTHQRPNEIYFLLDGIGRYFYIDEYGHERNKGMVRNGGAFVSIISLMSGQNSPFYTEAITPCLCARIPYHRLLEFGSQSGTWSLFIRRYYERLTLKREQRESRFLIQNPTERYSTFLEEFGEESELIPHEHIANWIGVTESSLTDIRIDLGLA